MSARPVLGIIACNRTVGTEVAQTVINRYATAAMHYADCAALIIPSLPDHMHAREIVGRLDGVLLTGTPSNVAPALYGDPAEGEGPVSYTHLDVYKRQGLASRMYGAMGPTIASRRPKADMSISRRSTASRTPSSRGCANAIAACR